MLEFDVTLNDAQVLAVPGDRHTVHDDGSLDIFSGEVTSRTFAAGEWILVTEVGTRLAERWPAPGIDYLLDEIHRLLCVGFGECDPVGTAGEYASPELNELGAFVAKVFEMIVRDPDLSSHRSEVEGVTALVRQHFHLSVS